MNLLEAYNLLVEDGIADNQRYFAELYKHFQFKDTDRLKEYLDFIIQEPVQWIHGFPTKLTTKTSFSKPKTAVIKLLKKDKVHQDVGRGFADKVHDVIWKTYKKEWENVLKLRERIRPVRISVNEQFDAESIDEQPLPPLRSAPSSVKTEECQEYQDIEETQEACSDSEHEAEHETEYETEHETEHEAEHEPHHETKNQVSDEVVTNIKTAPTLKVVECVPHTTKSDQERIEVLKEVIRKLASSLEPSVYDAFCLLVSHV
jgi:hypothetical protein